MKHRRKWLVWVDCWGRSEAYNIEAHTRTQAEQKAKKEARLGIRAIEVR